MSIEIRNVRKRFGDFHALPDVSLDVDLGELVAMLGPACGKTTLLRIIARLETADAGSPLFPAKTRRTCMCASAESASCSICAMCRS
jgi:ABC-type Fe3+/spermidine/putrescine transport system ATPase subunit